jgi:hypothetical protein
LRSVHRFLMLRGLQAKQQLLLLYDSRTKVRLVGFPIQPQLLKPLLRVRSMRGCRRWESPWPLLLLQRTQPNRKGPYLQRSWKWQVPQRTRRPLREEPHQRILRNCSPTLRLL